MPHKANTAIQLAKAIAVVLALSSPGFAQQPPVSTVRGEILGIAGKTVTIKTRDNQTLSVELTDKTAIVGLRKISLADIKPNAFVGVASVPEASGAQKAVSVHLFPESARGTNEGTRAYDVRPNSSMTNGAVADQVKSNDGAELTLKYKNEEKKVLVTPETSIVSFEPGKVSELTSGAKVVVNIRQPGEGPREAVRFLVGRDGITPAL